MSKPARPIDQINNDYAFKLAQLGEAEFKIMQLTESKAAIKSSIQVLEAEARRAQQSAKDKGLAVSLPSEESTPEVQEAPSEAAAG